MRRGLTPPTPQRSGHDALAFTQLAAKLRDVSPTTLAFSSSCHSGDHDPVVVHSFMAAAEVSPTAQQKQI